MDKLRILRSVELSTFQRLGADDIRTYLLLLTASRENGEGAISYNSLIQAFGRSFNMERVLEACRNLRKQGLIDGSFLLPDEPVEQDFVLRYRIAGDFNHR